MDFQVCVPLCSRSGDIHRFPLCRLPYLCPFLHPCLYPLRGLLHPCLYHLHGLRPCRRLYLRLLLFASFTPLLTRFQTQARSASVASGPCALQGTLFHLSKTEPRPGKRCSSWDRGECTIPRWEEQTCLSTTSLFPLPRFFLCLHPREGRLYLHRRILLCSTHMRVQSLGDRILYLLLFWDPIPKVQFHQILASCTS